MSLWGEVWKSTVNGASRADSFPGTIVFARAARGDVGDVFFGMSIFVGMSICCLVVRGFAHQREWSVVFFCGVFILFVGVPVFTPTGAGDLGWLFGRNGGG